MQAIAISFLDVVSVRDGRAFEAGGATLARALWPLPQWTVLGAIRALFIRALGLDPSVYGGRGWTDGPPDAYRSAIELLGEPDKEPNFTIGPILVRTKRHAAKHEEYLYPTPADLYLDSNSEVCRLKILPSSQVINEGFIFGFDYKYCALPPAGKRPSKKDMPNYVSSNQAETWLQGKVPTFEQFQDICVHERRIGICIDSAKGTVKEGMFYLRKGIALKDGFDLVVPIIDEGKAREAIQCLEKHEFVGELGGDRHLARFSLLKGFSFPKYQAYEKKAVLWFLSPVQVKDITSENLSKVCGHDVRVLTVVARRPVRIGGWRMARTKGESGPRPMRLYHPSGTCVYIEVDELEALSGLHGISVASDPEERASGFGVCLVGDFPRE